VPGTARAGLPSIEEAEQAIRAYVGTDTD
jgi:hypothetical protein